LFPDVLGSGFCMEAGFSEYDFPHSSQGNAGIVHQHSFRFVNGKSIYLSTLHKPDS
jgi:hypothetical protein